jgi:hypothetical protein
MDAQQFEKDDIIECLYSANGPVTKDYLKSKMYAEFSRIFQLQSPLLAHSSI